MRMRKITMEQRRRAMVQRHHLAGEADGPKEVTRALFALHATDPASVFLSVLARSGVSTLADVAEAMYERRSLVRWMAMRRTLFVFARADIPTVQAAVSTPLAVTLRRRLISRLQRNGTEPAIDGDVDHWLAGVEARTEAALTRRGTATGAQLTEDEPGLRTRILARAPSDRPQNLTTSLLTAPTRIPPSITRQRACTSDSTERSSSPRSSLRLNKSSQLAATDRRMRAQTEALPRSPF
jgi:hypothetical protein